MSSGNKSKPQGKSNSKDAWKHQKKRFYTYQAHDGHKGCVVTCDRGRDDRAAREVIDLFDEVAEYHFPDCSKPGSFSSHLSSKPQFEASHDLLAELEQELVMLRKSKKAKLFEELESNCQNVVFIKFHLDVNPIEFVNKAFDHLEKVLKVGRTRYSNKVLPMELTMNVNEDKIVDSFLPLIQRVFKDENPEGKPILYMIEIRSRNNNVIVKDALKARLTKAVGAGHFVELKKPQKILHIEIFAAACGIAIIDAATMEKYKGYNIRIWTDSFSGHSVPSNLEQFQNKPNSSNSNFKGSQVNAEECVDDQSTEKIHEAKEEEQSVNSMEIDGSSSSSTSMKTIQDKMNILMTDEQTTQTSSDSNPSSNIDKGMELEFVEVQPQWRNHSRYTGINTDDDQHENQLMTNQYGLTDEDGCVVYDDGNIVIGEGGIEII